MPEYLNYNFLKTITAVY